MCAFVSALTVRRCDRTIVGLDHGVGHFRLLRMMVKSSKLLSSSAAVLLPDTDKHGAKLILYEN